tara:strand:+ start:5813 stop:6814 length:1002 start_codon:yes stop_codon:yes gene_type:complete
MKILGIETSCDETAIAVYDTDKGIIGESIYTQIDIHSEYGGVVPELASRDHCSKIVSVLEKALKKTKISSIDKIAYTSGPGLLGALLIGESFAQGLSSALNIPLVSINHLEGHLMSPMMEFPELKMPFLCLLVSGGHSIIVDVKDKGEYEIIGQSKDDAVGEAFDKVAQMLGLPYPGGPHIEKIAINGNENAYNFPRPMINSSDLNMSLSGLKTSILYTVKKIDNLTDDIKANIAASFQKAVTEVLLKKMQEAVNFSGRSNIVIAGGVAANKYLREKFKTLEKKMNVKVYYPSMKYCGDNAAMIAFVGSKKFTNNNDICSTVRSRWPLDELNR